MSSSNPKKSALKLILSHPIIYTALVTGYQVCTAVGLGLAFSDLALAVRVAGCAGLCSVAALLVYLAHLVGHLGASGVHGLALGGLYAAGKLSGLAAVCLSCIGALQGQDMTQAILLCVAGSIVFQVYAGAAIMSRITKPTGGL